MEEGCEAYDGGYEASFERLELDTGNSLLGEVGGAYDLQAAHRERHCQPNFQALRGLQFPHDRHGQNQHDEIGDDVR